MKYKPLNRKSYGSIGHLPNSRLGESDSCVNIGQARICTEKTRDKHDTIIIQEKLDGSNVGIVKLNNEIIPLTRAGYIANTSPYKMHHIFYDWVMKNKNRFYELLKEGERVCGEWLLVAHGTRYFLPHEPFVAFDLMVGSERLIYREFYNRVDKFNFTVPQLISIGNSMSVDRALNLLDPKRHGCIDEPEGLVYRVERKDKVDFLAKYVKPNKIDGLYIMDDLTIIYNGYKEFNKG